MTHVNQLNAETQLKANMRETADRLAALLIALHVLTLEDRNKVMAQYERNRDNMKHDRQEQAGQTPIQVKCDFCDGDGERSTDVDDGEGHLMRGVGDKVKCICQIKE